jgi:Bacterial CdiA-CT RNAse A domain
MMLLLKSALPRAFACILAASFFLYVGCKQPAPASTTATNPGVDSVAHSAFRGTPHDLSSDELAGGHTLRKHVGRTDDELRDRLAHEDISASSTYTDKTAAEFAVGNALHDGQYRIEQWMQRSGGHPNLVLDYHGDQPIGRTLHRGDSSSQPCSDAKVVLRWLSSSEYYVLTSYPECR